MSLQDFTNKHKLLHSYKYTWAPIDKGYNYRTLYVNAGSGEIKEKPVSQMMKEKFTGGKGFGLKLLWDATKPTTRWNDPENEIVISMGPICGITQYSGTGKSLVVTLSPQTDIPVDSNVGGYFGPFLKFAGFDSLEIQGKAQNDVIILVDETRELVEIYEAGEEPLDSHLLAEYLTENLAETEKDRVNVAVVSAGSAADHSLIGMLNFSFFDARRKLVRLKQAGRGGIGTVLRDKKIKAIVAHSKGVTGNRNNVVDLQAIMERGKTFNREMRELDDKQCEMRSKGTAHLTHIMDDYDLLPVNNFKFGKHPDTHKINGEVWKSFFTQGVPDGCWIGCNMSCAKGVDNYELRSGPYKGSRVIVDGPEYESTSSLGSIAGIFNPDFTIESNFYCDTYGICTISWGTILGFVMECYENGILNEERTGLKLNFGNADNAMELLHMVARGEGFGKIAGLGVKKMKEMFAANGWGDAGFLQDIGMENKGLEYSQYVSKESLAQQGGYAMTNKGPQHDEAWLIFMDMVNNQIPTFEKKAEALHYFPMFRTWFGLQGLCKLPWNDVEPEDNAQTDEPAKVPQHVDNYITIYKAVTGSQNFDKHELIRQSERVYNFQRTFNIRMGKGLRLHDAQPYRACGPVTEEEYLSRQERYDKQLLELQGIDPSNMTLKEKMAATRKYRENRYEQLLDAVYKRRGWTPNGVPTISHLKELGMDLPEVLEIVTPLQ